MRKRIENRRVVLAVFGVLFVALFAIVGVANGVGHPSIASDEIAVVEDAPDGHVTSDEFEAALEQTAVRQGVQEVPPPSDPQYAALRDAAMADVLLSRWVRGEAEERGIAVTESEVSDQLDEIVKTQFGGEKQFQQFLKQSHFTLEEAQGRVELQLLSNEIQKEVLPESASVPESQIESFYEANKSQFEQPETRDVRQIVNKDQAKLEQAKSLLTEDDSPASWKTVAARFSTDKATKDSGGLRSGVAQGESDPTVDQQVFSAAEGELVGPFKVGSSYYLIEVEKINPAQTTQLSDASERIKQQLSQGAQQEIAQAFQQDFLEKWTSRTFCAEDYLTDRCGNFTPSDPCIGDDPGEQSEGAPGCGAVVTSSRPVSPGQASLFPGQAAQGLPQGPIQSPAPGGQPGVLGPPGAPAPPGAAPPGAAPPGAAPPGTAPPSEAPPAPPPGG